VKHAAQICGYLWKTPPAESHLTPIFTVLTGFFYKFMLLGKLFRVEVEPLTFPHGIKEGTNENARP
jgi:hypothetical protein